MKKMYRWMAMIGILIWVTTIFLRETPVADGPIVGGILGVMPNFGSFWVVFGLVLEIYPRITRCEFNMKYSLLIVAIIFAAILLSELVHHLFFQAALDVWDIVSSLTSAAGLIFAKWIYRKVNA